MATATKKEKKKLTLGRPALVAGTQQTLSNLLRLSISMDTVKAHLHYQKSALIWGEDSKIYPIYFYKLANTVVKLINGGGGIIGTFKFREIFDESNSKDERC
jgi:hypothetical protein